MAMGFMCPDCKKKAKFNDMGLCDKCGSDKIWYANPKKVLWLAEQLKGERNEKLN